MRFKDLKLKDRLLLFFRGKPTTFKVIGLSRKVEGTHQMVYFESNGRMYYQTKKEFETTKWSVRGK